MREHARWLLPLAVALLVSYAYFVPSSAWNQNSRLALTRALVEDGSTVIDQSHVTTGDKSFRDGHFYSDKAPGVSLLSIPPYAVLYAVRRATGGELPEVSVRPLDPKQRAARTQIEPLQRQPGDRLVYNRAHRLALWLCTVFAISIPTVLGSAAVFLLALAQTENRQRAAWTAVTFALGTPVFVYATSLYGHALAAALLVIAFAALALETEAGGSSRSSAYLAGGCLGAAVVTEYTAAVVAAGFVVWAWRRHGRRFALDVTLAGAPFALVLAAYHFAAFGHPLQTGYDFVYREEFASGMAVRYGIGWPDPGAALSLLFGSYRGLFFISPILLLATWGLGRAISEHEGRTREPFIVAAAVSLYFWLLNAGYYMWDGGASAGPRHMTPALGFLVMGLPTAWRSAPTACRWILAVSIGQVLLLTAAAPEAAQFGSPLWDYAIDRVRHRDASSSALGTNLGALLGLRGPWSLVPLLALWAWLRPRPDSATSNRLS